MSAVATDIDRASEAIRAANHSTYDGPLDGPASYTAVGNLVELVDRLPQLLDHLCRSLRRADRAQHYDDRGHDAEHALCHAHGHLGDARAFARGLSDQLHAAHNHLGHVGRVLHEED